MIESAAPGIDVRELAARVRARVSETRENPRNVPVDALTLRSSVFIDLLEAHTNIADQKQQIRTQWPSHIGNRFPFDLAPVRRLCLGALAFLFKDQRHVNAALVAAFRDQISFNRQLLDQVRSLRDEVDALTRMQTPVPAERTPIVDAIGEPDRSVNENGSSASRAHRVAIVTPWFGPELRGGAEQQSWQLAHHLADRGHAVDVLTTCCRSFSDDWSSNDLRPGSERVRGLTVRRFRTDRRDRRAFERVNSILLGLDRTQLHRSVSPVGDDDAEAFCRNSINSAALYAHLAQEGERYDKLVFLPYMFGTTLFGLPIVARRAMLQPCLHDEAYAYLPRVATTVHAASALLFNSEGERDVATTIFGPGIMSKSFVVGEGIDLIAEEPAAAERTTSFESEHERYVLYIGRQDPAKNVATLVAAFKGFRRSAPASRLKLVFAGERHVSYNDSSAGIVDLGPVSERDKADLLRHCRVLAQPSLKESFSRVIYEAWLHARPVIVNAECWPTASVVARCGGGYLAGSTSAWELALRQIESEPDHVLDEIGSRGAACAREATPWPAVIDRYEHAFAAPRADAAPTDRWDGMPDPPLAAALADGKKNLLYAGPIVSIENVDQLLVVFLHLLTMERESRLTIAATAGTDALVFEALENEVRRLDLVDRLLVTREPTTAQLQALYLGADVFVSLDRGTSGIAELKDAMWFDIPVLALDTPHNRAIANDSAILIDDATDLLAIAALAELLAKDDALRAMVVAAQRRVRARPSLV